MSAVQQAVCVCVGVQCLFHSVNQATMQVFPNYTVHKGPAGSTSSAKIHQEFYILSLQLQI